MSGAGSRLSDVADVVRQEGAVARAVLTAVEGSAPREVGAAMLVTHGDIYGTIGGGALEWEVILAARRMLLAKRTAGNLRQTLSLPLGPTLGQCCGGHVEVLIERFSADEAGRLGDLARPAVAARPFAGGRGIEILSPGDDPPRADLPAAVLRAARRLLAAQRPTLPARIRSDAGPWFVERVSPPLPELYLYGAGHVGRAVVRCLTGLELRIIWIDTAAARFPRTAAGEAERRIARSPARVAMVAPAEALHVVMTQSHALDLDICHAVLKRGDFRYLGLIGSETKRARFESRLGALGIAEDALSRLVCPIGELGLASKAPGAIAVGVAAEVLKELERVEPTRPVPSRSPLMETTVK